jgi:hypothetical protein
LWITFSLINLSILALLGMTMRTKFLFSMPFLDYRNFLSAHSHFAFGGWVTLILMTLLIDTLLNREQKNKTIYQVVLWGIQLCSFGMVLTFPFMGYNLVSIIFSTAFILFTYLFAVVFLADLRKTGNKRPVVILAVSAVLSLVVSSVGPFSLAYMMATDTGNAIQFRDAVYTFLHFQYNGFFTLSVLSLFFANRVENVNGTILKRQLGFAVFMALSIIPSLSLSLLWYPENIIKWSAYAGFILILVSLLYFSTMVGWMRQMSVNMNPVARGLLLLSLIAFALKMVLQTGTIIPSLGHAVFGFRPIIIGFLHLVFLGFITLFILSYLIENRLHSIHTKFARNAVIYFTGAIILNETILAVDGIGLLFYTTYKIYGWLLWVASIMLFTGALSIVISRLAGRHDLHHIRD